jgi:hypothetical protein
MRDLSILATLSVLTLSPLTARPDVPEDPWDQGKARLFLSGGFDIGTSEHTELAAGYGKPFHQWGGLQAEGWIGTDFAAAAMGLRANLRAVDLAAALRSTRTWKVMPLPDVDRQESLPTGGGFTYRTLDLSGSGGIPTPGGFAIWQVQAVRFLDPPGGAQIYEQVLRLACKPPWCATAQAGWLLSLRQGALLAGPAVEWAFRTGRGDATPLIRVGPLLSWRLWPHIQLQGGFRYPVSDPDRLPFQARLRVFLVLSYGVATGEQSPRFP